MSLPPRNAPKEQVNTLPTITASGDDQNRAASRVISILGSINSPMATKKMALNMSRTRFKQRLHPRDLPRLGDDRPDDERAQAPRCSPRLRRQQRDAEAQAQHGDDQHLVALEAAHIDRSAAAPASKPATSGIAEERCPACPTSCPTSPTLNLPVMAMPDSSAIMAIAQNVFDDQDAEDELRESAL